MAQDSVAVDQGIFVRLLVALVEVPPVAAVVAVHVGRQVDPELDGTGRGDCHSQREAWFHDSVCHGRFSRWSFPMMDDACRWR